MTADKKLGLELVLVPIVAAGLEVERAQFFQARAEPEPTEYSHRACFEPGEVSGFRSHLLNLGTQCSLESLNLTLNCC